MSKGKVKWFSNTRGYGFILADGSDKDIFFHHSSIQMEGYRTLKEGDAVEFELVDGPKGPKAENVSKAEAPPPALAPAPPALIPAPPPAQDQPTASA